MGGLLELEPPDEEVYQLQWDPGVLNLPFLQKCNGKIETADTFFRRLKQFGFHTGYRVPATVHDFRAEGLYLISMFH
jgi:hypothetical protein